MLDVDGRADLCRHYERTFRTDFEAELAQAGEHPGAVALGKLKRRWKTRMAAEAARQEHYDFTTDANGRRTVIWVDDNAAVPRLLIPEVRITG